MALEKKDGDTFCSLAGAEDKGKPCRQTINQWVSPSNPIPRVTKGVEGSAQVLAVGGNQHEACG